MVMFRKNKILIRQAITYAALGAFCFVEEFLLYKALHNYYGLNIYAANSIAIAIASVTSFLSNCFINFKTKNKILNRYIKFIIVISIGVAVSNLIIKELIVLFDKEITKLISMPIVIAIQFSLFKLWVYRK